MKFNVLQFTNSMTGVSAIVGATLIVAKRYDLAAAVFIALSIGSAGVLWERYSRRVGSHMSLKAFLRKEKPVWEGEVDFLVNHLPYATLAAVSYFLAKRKVK